jgi:glucose-6-phosphate-specific signal transduction histidine kinase
LHVIVSEEALFLQIADRGRGFDLDEAGALATNGLRGMRERAELLGGKLRIDANPGAGVTVTVNLPLGSDQHPHEQNLIRQNQEGASRLPPPPQLIAAL